MLRTFQRLIKSPLRQTPARCFSVALPAGDDFTVEDIKNDTNYSFKNKTIAIALETPLFNYQNHGVLVSSERARLIHNINKSEPSFVTVVIPKSEHTETEEGTHDFHKIGTYCQVEGVSDTLVNLRTLHRVEIQNLAFVPVPNTLEEFELSDLKDIVSDKENALASPVISSEITTISQNIYRESSRVPGDTVMISQNEKIPLVGEKDLTVEQRVKVDLITKMSSQEDSSGRVDPMVKEISRQDIDTVINNVGTIMKTHPMIRPQKVLQLYMVKDLDEALNLCLECLETISFATKAYETVLKKVAENQKMMENQFFTAELLSELKKRLKNLKGNTMENLYKNFMSKNPPKAARVVFEESFKRLKLIDRSHHEHSILKHYLEWIACLPFGVRSSEEFNIDSARRILDNTHYGMQKVKDRILEHLSVGKLRSTLRGKIICLEGPPGTGKTSLAFSIAKAMNRKCFRLSLGGENDPSTLKGHRRTYVSSRPGKIIQALKECQSENCVIIIDEIDKINSNPSIHGDPQNPLLEILDPEQNNAFVDNFIDFPVDLSNVLFICTANDVSRVSKPLLDRMEIIEISSYTADEKRNIFNTHILPTAIKEAGLSDLRQHFSISEDVVESLITNYCRESGVRSLQKKTTKIVEKIAYELVHSIAKTAKQNPEPQSESHAERPEIVFEDSQGQEAEAISKSEASAQAAEQAAKEKTAVLVEQIPPDFEKIRVEASNLVKFIDLPIFDSSRLYKNSVVGVVKGLAYNYYGGSVLFIETNLSSINSKKSGIKYTGMMDDVMKESVSIAYSNVRHFLKSTGNEFLEKCMVHVHIPEGGIPKDGPSAGIAVAASLVSFATKQVIPHTVAMTGEISLKGRVMSVRGLKEKLLAAKREEVKTVLLSEENKDHVEDLEKEVTEGLDIRYVKTFKEVCQYLEKAPN